MGSSLHSSVQFQFLWIFLKWNAKADYGEISHNTYMKLSKGSVLFLNNMDNFLNLGSMKTEKVERDRHRDQNGSHHCLYFKCP